MEYKFKCGEEIIDVEIREENYLNLVNVKNGKHGFSFEREIQEDEKGKFFIYHENKIYLNDWIKTSMKEFKERVDKGECVNSNDLCLAILSDGIDNVRFIVPLNTRCSLFLLNGEEFKKVLCKIVESYNREIKTCYKISVVRVEEDESVSSGRDYYMETFLDFIKEGIVEIVLN